MGAAVTALSWELLARCRWWLVLSAGLMALLGLAGLASPPSWHNPGVAGWLVAFVAIPVMAMVGSTVHAEGTRLEDAGSLFPARLYTLPVPTVALVGPPLLLGTLTLTVYWLLTALCILRPWGMQVPLFWPGLAAAAVLASVQALVWLPFPMPWLRAIALFIVLPGLLAGALFLAQRETPEVVMSGSSVSVMLAAYALALIGVSHGRHGTGVRGTPQDIAPTRTVITHELPPFARALEAQEWLERRRLRYGFIILTLICLLVTALFMWLTDSLLRSLKPEALGDDMRQLRTALTLFGRSWLVLMQVPLIPLLISAASGGSALGKLTVSAESQALSEFLATRPMRTADMVAAKLLSCARGVIISWTVLYTAGLLWAVCMGRIGELTEFLIARAGSVPAALLALFAGLVAVPAISWLWLISGMGGKIVRWSILEMLPAFFSVSVLLFPGLLLTEKLEPWRPVMAGFVLAALVGKTLAVCWVTKRLRMERLIQNRTIQWGVATWVMLASVVLALTFGVFAASPLVAGVAILLLPLARPLATPLVLARHRTQ